MNYESIAENPFYRLFRKYAYKNSKKYAGLKENIRKAHIPVPCEAYISMQFAWTLASAVTGLFAGLGIACIFGLISYIFLVPIFAFSFASVVYLAFRFRPSFVSSIRAKRIDATLAHAVTYMYAMGQGGMNLTGVFHSIVQHREIYPEISLEIERILRDIEFMGYDIITALENARDRTPSAKFRDFVDGMISILNSGGSVTSYMSAKSEQYQVTAAENQKIFLDFLSIIAESYVTAFVAGPLFLIVILLTLGFVGGGYLMALGIIVYLLIPVSTVAFLLLLDRIAPFESGGYEVHSTKRELDFYRDVEVVDGGKKDEISREVFMKQTRVRKMLVFARNPLKIFYENPSYVLVISLPLSIIYLLSSLSREPLASGNTIVLSLLIALAPFVVFYEGGSRRMRKMEKEIPEFLKRVLRVHQIGLGLTKAINIIADSKLGVLGGEIRRISRDIEWGTLTTDALRRFQRRANTSAIARVMTLITNASKSSSNINEVLSIAADEAAISQSLKRERFNNTMLYVIVVYIAFSVFLIITYILTRFFLPVIPTPGAEVNAQLMGTIMATGAGKEEYELLLYHATLIQGFCTGLVAGKMGEGSTKFGLKHSLIMIATAYVLFSFMR